MRRDIQYGHEGQHHGSGAPGCPTGLHHHHDERCTPPRKSAYDSERNDRFERARDAAFDAPGAAESQMPDIDAAIETATRVRITPEIVAAYRARRIELSLDAISGPGPVVDMDALIKGALEAAFGAAGFEVES